MRFREISKLNKTLIKEIFKRKSIRIIDKKDIYINKNSNNRDYWNKSQGINFIMIWDYHFLEENLGFEYLRIKLLELEIDDLDYILIIIWNLWK